MSAGEARIEQTQLEKVKKKSVLEQERHVVHCVCVCVRCRCSDCFVEVASDVSVATDTFAALC